MADRVFCIDFGSAFTKVALRADPTATTELIQRPGAYGLDGSDFCFPSVVAINRRDPANQRCEFGQDAVDLKTGNGIDVYRNWKKWLFQEIPATPAESAPSPLSALLNSEEFVRLAASFGVSPAEGRFLRQIITASEEFRGKPATPPLSLEVKQQHFAGKLAVHYFTWLRKQVLEGCRKLNKSGLRYEDIPVRVTAPAFGTDNPGMEAIQNAVKQAGWPLHTDYPIVTEPESNILGVLTNACNTITPQRKIQYIKMLKGPLQTVLRNPGNHPAFRAIVIDVGAYTTDMAVFTLDTHGGTVEDPRTAYTISQKSVPIGISQLDEQIQAAVTDAAPERGEAISNFTSSQWDDFRRAVYQQSGKPYRVLGTRTVIGKGIDEVPIQEALQQFAESVVAEVTAFSADHGPVWQDELILSGGGSMIPAIRTAILNSSSVQNHHYFRVHAADIPKSTNGTRFAKLNETLARGGSAIGGASLFFESSYY